MASRDTLYPKGYCLLLLQWAQPPSSLVFAGLFPTVRIILKPGQCPCALWGVIRPWWPIMESNHVLAVMSRMLDLRANGPNIRPLERSGPPLQGTSRLSEPSLRFSLSVRFRCANPRSVFPDCQNGHAMYMRAFALADVTGFEPVRDFHPCWFSKPVP